MSDLTLEQAVAELELTSADEIADVLRRHRVTGLRVAPRDCPVANYLELRTGRSVSVDGCYAHFASRVDDAANVDLPDVAIEFVGLFDCGAYPELVRDDTSAELR
jgi:hypothetical protein